MTVSDQISALTFLSPSDSCDNSEPPENDSSLSEVLAVRVKGGMSLRNGMWHGLRNDIIMRNLIYADRF